jgi:hypothetical protein
VFAALVSLITTLYDRYRPIYLARARLDAQAAPARPRTGPRGATA